MGRPQRHPSPSSLLPWSPLLKSTGIEFLSIKCSASPIARSALKRTERLQRPRKLRIRPSKEMTTCWRQRSRRLLRKLRLLLRRTTQKMAIMRGIKGEEESEEVDFTRNNKKTAILIQRQNARVLKREGTKPTPMKPNTQEKTLTKRQSIAVLLLARPAKTLHSSSVQSWSLLRAISSAITMTTIAMMTTTMTIIMEGDTTDLSSSFIYHLWVLPVWIRL